MRAGNLIARLLAAALALVPSLAVAQSSILGFPPGMFENRAALAGSSGAGPITMPLLSQGGNVTGPSNAANSFGALLGSNPANYSTNTSILGRTVVAIPGTISQLSVTLPTAVTTGTSWDFALYVNNSTATALHCTIAAAGGGSGQISSTQCADTVNSVVVAAGNYVGWKLTPTGTPTAEASVQISAQLTSTNNNESIIAAGGTGNFSNAAANYVGFGGITGSPNATEVNASSVIPTGGTIDNLYALSFASVNTTGYVLTLYKNGVATALHCTLTGTTPCNDTSGADAVAVTALDTISIQACPGTHSGVSGSCTLTGTTTAGPLYAGARWTPTIAGEAIVMATTIGSPANAATNYYNINGTGNNSVTTETNVQNVAPIGFTIKKLAVSLATAPGGAGSRNVVLRSGAANVGTPGTLTCPSAITTGTTCQDTTNSYTASAGALLDWATTVSGSPNSTLGWRAGAVVTVP